MNDVATYKLSSYYVNVLVALAILVSAILKSFTDTYEK